MSILVIGATNWDVIASYESKWDSMMSKTGTVQTFVGGAAFNVAANLSASDTKLKVRLWTYVSPSSAASSQIRIAMERIGLDSSLVQESTAIGDPTYIAHFCEGTLRSGVTSSTIEAVELDTVRLERAVKCSTFVAIDTNMSGSHIASVAAICKQHAKPLAVAIVSPPKALRITEHKFPLVFALVSMNVDEARQLGLQEDGATEASRKDFLRRANSRLAVVSRGQLGHSLFLQDGSRRDYPAPEVNVKSDLGAGDALFAAMCATLAKEEDPTSNTAVQRVAAWVSNKLRIDEPNLATQNGDRLTKRPLVNASRVAIAMLAICVALAIGSGAMAGDKTSAALPIPAKPDVMGLVCFFGCALTAGCLGGVYNFLHRTEHGRAHHGLLAAAVFGATAGLVASALYLTPLFSADHTIRFSSFWAICIIPAAILAGVATDKVMRGDNPRRAAPEEA